MLVALVKALPVELVHWGLLKPVGRFVFQKVANLIKVNPVLLILWPDCWRMGRHAFWPCLKSSQHSLHIAPQRVRVKLCFEHRVM